MTLQKSSINSTNKYNEFRHMWLHFSQTISPQGGYTGGTTASPRLHSCQEGVGVLQGGFISPIHFVPTLQCLLGPCSHLWEGGTFASKGPPEGGRVRHPQHSHLYPASHFSGTTPNIGEPRVSPYSAWSGASLQPMSGWQRQNCRR